MSEPNATPPALDRLQRWMQAVLTHPLGVESGAHSPAAVAEIDVGPAGVERIIERSKAMTSGQRLDIYHKAYYARLIECLASEFPILAKTVGEEVFHGFAYGYLQRFPSRSYTLAKLGENFAEYLRETRPEREVHDAGSSPSKSSADWADFLIELATVEWTFNEVFDGPGAEQSPPLDLAALAQVNDEASADVRLVPDPSLRLLATRFPINMFYSAARSGDAPPLPAPADSYLAVHRRNYIVRRHELSREQHALLSQLIAGSPLSSALAAAAPLDDAAFDAFGTKISEWFQAWSAEGYFVAVKASAG